MESENSSKKNKIKGLVSFIVCFSLFYFIGTKCSSPSVEKSLKITVEKINKTCPVFVDESTRLDSTVYIPERTIEYCYTIIDESITKSDSAALADYLLPVIIENIKEESDLKDLKDNDVTFKYNYRLFDRSKLMEFTITPDMYKN